MLCALEVGARVCRLNLLATYVRSYRGTDGAWYRHATQHSQGRVRAGGIERDVTVDRPDDTVQTAVDDGFRAKYARYGNAYLQPMLAPGATATTLRLTPRKLRGRSHG